MRGMGGLNAAEARDALTTRMLDLLALLMRLARERRPATLRDLALALGHSPNSWSWTQRTVKRLREAGLVRPPTPLSGRRRNASADIVPSCRFVPLSELESCS